MRSIIKISLASYLALVLSACTGGDGSNLNRIEDDEIVAQNALADPYSTLGLTDESSNFGDAQISSLDDEETPYADPYASSTTALMANTQSESPESCDTYFVRMRWGQFKGLSRDIQNATDWSGQVSVNVGKLTLISTLAFDKQDAVATRSDPKIIAFTSKTLPHFDGLRLKYEVCASDKVALATDELPSLSFSAPSVPYSVSYTSAELVLLNSLVENIDASGNRFQIQSTIKSDLCQGTLEGHWTMLTSKRGIFRGRVVAQNGVLLGHVKGVFGEKENGEKALAGKFIAKRGRFKGMVQGSYADNSFSGKINNRAKEEVGQIEGSYTPGDMGEKGTFSANYTLNCADVPSANE